MAAGAVILVVAVAAAALALTLGSGSPTVAPPNSVGVVDPATLELGKAIDVGNTPTDVAASDDWVWVVNSNDGAGTISRIDTRSRQRVSTFSVGGTPRAILAAFDSLWVGTSEGRVYRVEPSTDIVDPDASQRGQELGIRARCRRRVVGRGEGRRVGSEHSHDLAHRPGHVAAGIASERGLGADGLRLWLALWSWVWGAALGAHHAPRRHGHAPGGAADLVVGLGSVWVADDEGQAILRIDPRQAAVVRTYELGGSPLGVAAGDDAVGDHRGRIRGADRP